MGSLTQRQRGWILTVVFAGLIFGYWTADRWASRQADRKATATSAQLQAALPQFKTFDLRVQPERFSRMFNVRSIIDERDGVRVNIEVSSLWRVRCIVGHLNSNGGTMTETFDRGCQG